MKKRLLSLLCVLVLTVSVIPAASALEGEAARAADTLSTLGLIDSTYNLDAPATRAQAAVLLVHLAGAEQAAAADNWLAGFRDVPASIAQEVTYAARQVADRCAAAVFRLDTYETEAYRDEGLVTGEASGFFITEDGLAITNYHSIADAVSATATLSTGDVYEVERVIYYDPDIDIAVIRVSHAALKGHDTSAFATLDIADSGTGDLRAGDTVYAIGNPLGLGLAVSSGIVSATQRDVERYALPCVMSTADISEGSSGGALLNVYGQAVAVTSGAYVYGNSMYLAVPIDPILTADLTGEGLTLPEVLEAETVG